MTSADSTDVLVHTEQEIQLDQVTVNVHDEVADQSEPDRDPDPEAEMEMQTLQDPVDNDEVNKTHLREIFEETQCPLVPSKYDKDGELCGAYYFNDELWKEIGDDSCALIDFKNEKMKRKAMDDAELMMAVDKFISHVHINKSSEIHEKLMVAYKEANSDFDDGDTSNDAYQKLIPTLVGMPSVDCMLTIMHAEFEPDIYMSADIAVLENA